VVAAPAVVAALAVGGKVRPKSLQVKAVTRLGEVGSAVEHANLVHGALEGGQALTELGEQVGMGAIKDGAAGGLVGLSTVEVVTADLAKKDLALSCRSRRALPGVRLQ